MYLIDEWHLEWILKMWEKHFAKYHSNSDLFSHIVAWMWWWQRFLYQWLCICLFTLIMRDTYTLHYLFCLKFNWCGSFLNFYSTGEAMWLATNVSDTLESYTVIAWWLWDCQWNMTHCFQLAGITLLWIAGVKIGWEILQLQCILAHMIGENFHHS